MSTSLLKLKTPKGTQINFEPVKLYEQGSLNSFFKGYLDRVEKPISSLHDRLCSKEDLEGKVAISLYLDKLMNNYIYSLPLKDEVIEYYQKNLYQSLLAFVNANKEKFELEENSNSDSVLSKQSVNDDLTKNTEHTEDIKGIYYQLKKNTIKSNIYKKTKSFTKYPFKKLQKTSIKFVIEEIDKFLKNKQEKSYLDDFFEPQIPDFVLAVIFYDFNHFKNLFTAPLGSTVPVGTNAPIGIKSSKSQLKQKDLIDFVIQCLKELYNNPLNNATHYDLGEYNIFKIAANPESYFECEFSIPNLLENIERRFKFKCLNLLLVSDFIKEVVTNYVTYKVNVLKTTPFLNKDIFDQCLELLVFYFVLSYTNKTEEINIKEDPIFNEMLALLIKHHHLFSLNEDVFNSKKIEETFKMLKFNYPKKTFKFRDNKNLVFSKDLDFDEDEETYSYNTETEEWIFESTNLNTEEAYSDNFIRSYFAKSVIKYLSKIFKLSYEDAKSLLPSNEDTNNYMKRLSCHTLLSTLQNSKTTSSSIKQILEILEKSNTKFNYRFFITPEFQLLNAKYLEYHNNISLALSNETLAIKSNKTVHLLKFKLNEDLKTIIEIETTKEDLQSFNNRYFGTGDAFENELLVFNI